MSVSPNSQYTESKVLTASQPQLHLMLLEGAVRFGTKAEQLWGDESQATVVEELLNRMADILEELTHSTCGQGNDISSQLEEQYAFAFRELAMCRVNHDLQKLNDCLKLLQYQRETWKQVCDELQAESTNETTHRPAAPQSPRTSPANSASFTLDA